MRRSWRCQRASATCFPSATDGAGTVAGGGSFFMSPGRRNVAGETDGEALKPLQPAAAKDRIPTNDTQMSFRRISDGRVGCGTGVAIGFIGLVLR